MIPDELYDTSELTYDISDAEIQELMALDVPTNWEQTKDPELRAKYYHAHLLKQFGNIPAVHIVAAREREKILTGVIVFATVDEMVDFEKAKYGMGIFQRLRLLLRARRSCGLEALGFQAMKTNTSRFSKQNMCCGLRN